MIDRPCMPSYPAGIECIQVSPVELDIRGCGAIGRRGARTDSTEMPSATPVGLVVLIMFLAFREGGEDGQGGEERGELETE